MTPTDPDPQSPLYAPMKMTGQGTEKPRSKGKRRSGKNKNKYLSQEHQQRRFLIGGCFILGCVVVFSSGYYFGQNSPKRKDTTVIKAKSEVVLPTVKSEELLDAAFGDFFEGNPRKAMHGFQKVKDAQPALYGIDYLVAESSFRAGELVLAEQAAQHAVSCNELAGESKVLLALIALGKTTGPDQGGHQFSDPLISAEEEFRRFAAEHPADAAIYGLWADVLRGKGSYSVATRILHRGVLRADPMGSQMLLSAKEKLSKLQEEPAKSVASIAEITAMTGEAALVAGFSALQNKQDKEALLFLEKAQDFYPPVIFRQVLQDVAFDPYRGNPLLGDFFKQHSSQPVTIRL